MLSLAFIMYELKITLW